MAFVWFLLFVAVGIWGFRASRRVAGLHRHNAALAADSATLQAHNHALHQHSLEIREQLQRAAAENQTLHQHWLAVQEQMRNVAAENQELGRYRAIVDVDREIHQRRAAVAAEEAAARNRAGGVIGGALEQAASVVADAFAKAQGIADDALDAKRNAEAYRLEVRALKNIVDGYGDQYLVATETLLDGLAESFAHTDGGAHLKEARQRTRNMIKNGTAATCDYVEEERRQAALSFVADAFNGKAETTLAKAKVDNFGTLRQELVDSFAVVNKNGRAFRNARILSAYLEARVEELRWAVVTHELREREREEQRLLKERIREEEKARRDYERAQKEAAKEEDVIRRAMARAQAEIAQATDVQRSKYEAQLQELALRLQAAEERNQRAISMAQQTKRGHVYIISNVGSFGEDVFKIGLTRRLEPIDRIKELGDASVPFEFDVHALIVSDDAPALERALHRHFIAAQLNKVNPRKEFFRATLTMIRAEVEKLGIAASWTMAAAATQYRESTAVERAIKDDPAAYKAWVNRQLVLDPVTIDEADEDEVATTTGRVPAVAVASA